MGSRPPQKLDRDSLLSELRGKTQFSDYRFDRAAIDEERRTVALSFASEDPYRRWWGVEILDLQPASVRMDRLKDAAALLVNHDRDQQVGVIALATIDRDRKGRAVVRFGNSTFAEEIFRDVIDGIRTKVSVGYLVHKLVLEKEEDDVSTYRVTDWEPLEISIVSVPADATVGVGRDARDGARSPIQEESMTEQTKAGPPAPTETPAAALARNLQDQNGVAAQQARDEMAQRNQDILSIAKRFDHIPGVKDASMLAIGDAKMTVDAFREVALDLVGKHQAKPTRTGQLEEDRLDRDGQNWENARAVPYSSIRYFKGVGQHLGMKDHEAAHRAGMFLRATLHGDTRAAQWCRDAGVMLHQGRFDGAVLRGQDVDTRAIGGGVFTSGGWLMPTELSTAIIMNRELYGVARRICNVIPMTTATLQIPRITSGVTAYFVGEGTQGTTSDPAGDQVGLTLKDLMATTKIGKSTAQDSAIPLAEMVANEQARARAVKEDNCLVLGDGTSTYGGMQGVRTLLNAAANSAGVAAAQTGHDTFAEVDATDVAILIGQLPVYARAGARWLCSGVFDATVFARLKLGAGGNTVQTVQGQVTESDYAGWPITIAHDMPSSATNGAVMLIFGNFNLGVAFGAGEGMMMTVDPYSLADYNQTKITTVERIDIVAHGVARSTTAGAQGPIVGLDATT
jgi:HK97 family phage major capsid protein